MQKALAACVVAACAHAPPPDRPFTVFERTNSVLMWDETDDDAGPEYAFQADLLDGALGVRTASARKDAREKLLSECPPPRRGRVLGDGLAPAGLPPEVAAWVAISEWQNGATSVRSTSDSSSTVDTDGFDAQKEQTGGHGRFRLGRVECATVTRTSNALSDSGDSPLDNAIREFGSPRQQDLEGLGLVHEHGLVLGRMGRVEGGYDLLLHISGLTNALSVSALETTWSLLCRSDAPIYVRDLPVALSGQPVGDACRVGAGPVADAATTPEQR
jgi:hypothetical protein